LKNLILISNYFPEKGKETFLVEELPFLAKYFEKVIIFTLKPTKNHINIPTNVTITNVLDRIVTKRGKFKYLILNWVSCLKALSLEKKKGGLSLLLKYGVQSQRLESFLKEHNMIITDSLYYSYWLDEGAAILALLKEKRKKVKFISRAHGYDLYEEDYPNGLPYFYNYALSKINKIYFISENGKEYFKENHKTNIPLEVSKLGTKDSGMGPLKGKEIVIATCSSIIPLKRLNLLAESLTKLKFSKVVWHHHGDGPLKIEVLDIVSNFPNIETHFHGQVANESLMEFYKITYISLFVNVSRTEGLPVSLIEAASFGIPLLATNVRGTKEICTNKTGILVDSSINAEDLAKQIENAVHRDWDRKVIREYWESHFIGKNNFNEFARAIGKL
jgi:glycosyltransferase involved in cell wall biosynthesis